MTLKDKNKIELRTICDTCGKPIAEKARSNVTRFLFSESRCMCQLTIPKDQTAEFIPEVSAAKTADQSQLKVTESSVAENLGERYEVQSLLGQGGMGAVYKVRDKNLEKTFAVKVLNPDLIDDSVSIKRFEQEAEAASGLTSPNLVAVYDFGVGKKGSPYIVMDYLDGHSLAEVIKEEGYLDVPRALDLFIQSAEAVAHAHNKSVIHRDIKPSNIILTRGIDGGDFVKLVDFGIAKVLPRAEQAGQNLTQTGDIFGSPLYMSPEQCLGNKLDARSDIYALGCVMYETLTGKPPFQAENPIKTILKQINDEPVPISKLAGDSRVPVSLEAIVGKCLAKNPDHRYQTAEQLLEDLQAVRDGRPVRAQTAAQKSERSRASKRLVIVAGITSLILSISTVAWVYVATQKTPPQPVKSPSALPSSTLDPNADAARLDQLSYQYFMQKDYEKAIPLLLFGISAYKGNNPTYLADNYQHVGKCYKELGKYSLAADNYEKALKIYEDIRRQYGRPYGMVDEARKDYAEVLRKLGQEAKAKLVQDGGYVPTSPVEPAPNLRP